jgi:hypothetical protein
MNITSCQSCGMPFSGAECPVCAPLERVLKMSREKRRDYAVKKAAQRSATSHADKSQPKEK